jgi:hypothetical protein
MQMFNVILGRSRVQFSVWALNGRYQGRVNDIVIYESTDYEAVRADLLFDFGSNHINSSLLLN